MVINDLPTKAAKAAELEIDDRFKLWAKWIDRVDETKSNGFCFIGDFIQSGTVEVKLTAPRLILVQSASGSRRYPREHYAVVKMLVDATLEKTDIHTTNSERGWALRIRDKVVEYLKTMQSPALLPQPDAVDQLNADELHLLLILVRLSPESRARIIQALDSNPALNAQTLSAHVAAQSTDSRWRKGRRL